MAWFRRDKKSSLALDPVAAAPAVKFRQVTCSRENKLVLSGLSLTINEQRVGIIGDNGSGKSTFARLLNGLLLADTGQVEIYGHDAVKHSARLPALVGFLFQNPDHQILFPTVLEELCFGLQQQGMSQSESEALSRAYLHSRGKEAWANRPAQSLSEGEKQRLCLWSVLLMQPKLLVLDETFASLDLRSRLGMMHELTAQRQQLIMVTHELSLLRDFDRVIWLHQGSIRADGDPPRVIEEYQAHAREGL